jgi:hypothetical protein
MSAAKLAAASNELRFKEIVPQGRHKTPPKEASASHHQYHRLHPAWLISWGSSTSGSINLKGTDYAVRDNEGTHGNTANRDRHFLPTSGKPNQLMYPRPMEVPRATKIEQRDSRRKPSE